METTHRKRVSARKRRNRNHGGLPKLAAELAGCSTQMVYKVLEGRATSAPVRRAINEAARQLGIGQERVA